MTSQEEAFKAIAPLKAAGLNDENIRAALKPEYAEHLDAYRPSAAKRPRGSGPTSPAVRRSDTF
jgi:hypothetical protein